MNPCIPDWNIDSDLPAPTPKKSLGSLSSFFRAYRLLENDLVELLWQNGQVVLSSQNLRKPGYDNPVDLRQLPKHDQPNVRGGNPTNLVQDNETISWIDCPIDESFEKEFCSNFLSEIEPPNPSQPDKQFEDARFFKFGASNTDPLLPRPQGSGSCPNQAPPPKFHNVNVVCWSSNPLGGKGSNKMVTQGEIKECSMMTVGSSHCGSNQVANDADTSRFSSSGIVNGVAVGKDRFTSTNSPSNRETSEPAIASSSGGSGSSFERTFTQSAGTKRKTRDGEDSECQSETAELGSASRKQPAQKSGSSRRSRAAEVHNLSERRRRDRINEKMRALQELLPHSSKTDKASMLDEAIEYLKSLQIQLQMMWMGSGMATMMFPGVQHYMSRMGMGMGMGAAAIPGIANSMQLPRLPLVNQTIQMAPTANQASICQTPMLNQVNYQRQLQNLNFSEQYASFMALRHQQNVSQPLNIFGLGPHAMQQNQTLAPSSNNNGPSI